MKRRQSLKVFAGLMTSAWLLMSAGNVGAAEYPKGAVRVIVPYSPGGPPDAHARYIAEKLSSRLGQPFVVENRAGAGGTIAIAELLRNPADGQTLLLFPTPLAMAPGLYPNFKTSIEDEIDPIAQLSWQYNVLVVPPSLGVSSVDELVATIKASSDGGSYASGGAGTPAHIMAEMFSEATGIKPTHVPYNQFSQGIIDTTTGRVQFMFAAAVAVVGHIKSGRLKALAVASPERLSSLPDVPTLKELGQESVDMVGWTGIVAKAGTSEEIVQLLSKEITEVIASDESKAYFSSIGDQAAVMPHQEFNDFVDAESRRWSDYVRSKGISIQ